MIKLHDIVHIIDTEYSGVVVKKGSNKCSVRVFGTVNKLKICFKNQLQLQLPCIWCDTPTGEIHQGICAKCKMHLEDEIQRRKKVKFLKRPKQYKYLNKDWK